MLLPTTIDSDKLLLEHRSDQQLLIGRWLQPVALAESQAIYEALLQAALAHGGCRHWLIDIRRRPVSNLPLAQWFGEVFTPRLASLFAGQVSIAFFAMISHDEAATDPKLDENIRQGTSQGINYHYFNQEADCLAWLAQQP